MGLAAGSAPGVAARGPGNAGDRRAPGRAASGHDGGRGVARQRLGRGVQNALALAKQLLGEKKYQAAAEAYAQANERAGGHCGECLLGLARAKVGLGDLDAAIAAAQEAARALAGDPLQALAYQHVGDLLLHRAGSSVADLTAAEEAYGKALASGAADRAQALTGIAMSRFRRSLYPQALEAASAALAAAGGGPAAVPARVLLCRARRAGNLPPAQPPTTEAGQQEIFRIKGRVTKPVKISAPPPVYTEEARNRLINGAVILAAIIDQQGCVSSVHVLKGLDSGLDKAAWTAVENWVFEPATLDGRPVSVYYTLMVTFDLPPP